jgi:hypothetical protein
MRIVHCEWVAIRSRHTWLGRASGLTDLGGNECASVRALYSFLSRSSEGQKRQAE